MKFKLTGRHYIDDRLLEAGKEIGDGTDVPLPEDFVPSMQMEGVDEEGKRMVAERTGRPEPLSDIQVGPSPKAPSPLNPPKTQLKAPPGPPNEVLEPKNSGDLDLTLPETNKNVSGSKK